MPHLAQNEGMAERIEKLVGFKVLWSKLDIFQTVMVWIACQAELGDNKAYGVLAGLKRIIPASYAYIPGTDDD